MAIWRMRIACWITAAADTHLKYVMTLLFNANDSGGSLYVFVGPVNLDDRMTGQNYLDFLQNKLPKQL